MRWPWIVAGTAAVGVAAWFVAADGDAPQAPATDASHPRARVPASEGPRRDLRRLRPLRPKPFVGGRATVTERAGAQPGPPASPPPPTGIDAAEAEAGFEGVLERIEGMLDDEIVLDPAGYARWRGRANAAFAAYSALLDGSDPADAAKLEEAHRRLARALRALEERVREDPIRERDRQVP